MYFPKQLQQRVILILFYYVEECRRMIFNSIFILLFSFLFSFYREMNVHEASPNNDLEGCHMVISVIKRDFTFFFNFRFPTKNACGAR